MKNVVLAMILDANATMSKITVINNIQTCLEPDFSFMELSALLTDIFKQIKLYFLILIFVNAD